MVHLANQRQSSHCLWNDSMHIEQEHELLSQYLNVETCYHLALIPETTGSKSQKLRELLLMKTKFVQDTEII